MDTTTVLTSSVVATVLSTGLSFWISIYSKKHDFKYDYKRYILKNRQQAYEMVEELIRTVSLYTVTKDEKTIHPIFTKGSIEPIRAFNKRLIDSVGKSLWLSDAMIICITNFNKTMVEILSAVKKGAKTPQDLIEIGFNYKDELIRHKKILLKTYFNDIIELDDIDKYRQKKILK